MANRYGRSRPPLDDEELFAAWKLYQEHLARGGTMATAAAEIGISASALQQRTALYREKAGIRIQKRVPRTVREDDLKRAVDQIEKSIERQFRVLMERLDDIEREMAKRPVVVREFVPSHRRVADGGLPVNQQRKAFKRKMAS